MEYGLIGEKLSHSYSKVIHESLADYQYELKPLNLDEFHYFMEEKNFRAINVTIPYKRDVIPYLNIIDEKAKKIGAVNTIINKNGRLTGYNTDYDGFLYTLNYYNITIKNQKVLVLGNGGAALAVLAVLKFLEASEIIIVKHKTEPGTITYEEAKTLYSDASVIINTTPVGMYPNVDASPIDLSYYHSLTAVVDLIYNPITTKLLSQARELEIKAVGGLMMLVTQAKFAAELFCNRKLSENVVEPIVQKIEEELSN